MRRVCALSSVLSNMACKVIKTGGRLCKVEVICVLKIFKSDSDIFNVNVIHAVVSSSPSSRIPEFLGETSEKSQPKRSPLYTYRSKFRI